MPPILAFSGFSASGKTTLVSRVVEILSGEGLRLGVVKHHGHPRDEGEPAKDTDRHLAAGAVVALSGPGQGMTYWPQPGDPNPLVAAARLGDQVDLVLVEGFKGWAGFKIEVFGPKQGPRLVDDPLLIALAGPADDKDKAGQIAFFDRDDAEAVARLVRDCLAPPQRLSPVPDRETCFGLMARFAMPPNILVHSLMVAEAARRLAAALIRAGRRLDLPLTEAGGLLHDIAKAECLERRCDHATRGQKILLSLGYPHLAEVVAGHIDPRPALNRGGLVSPMVAINYTDKRVLHDRVVSLEERINDLMTRYGTTPQRSARMDEMAQESRRMEIGLFKLIDLEPADLEAINPLFAGPE